VPVHVRERDGLLMSLLLCEMMAVRRCGLGDLVADLEAVTGHMEYGRLDLRLDQSVMDAFVASWPTLAPAKLAGMPVERIGREDGVKFFLPDDAWMLLRASGTEPLVRIYAEAATAEQVASLQAAGRAMTGTQG
jgi:phosphomannomutase